MNSIELSQCEKDLLSGTPGFTPEKNGFVFENQDFSKDNKINRFTNPDVNGYEDRLLETKAVANKMDIISIKNGKNGIPEKWVVVDGDSTKPLWKANYADGEAYPLYDETRTQFIDSQEVSHFYLDKTKPLSVGATPSPATTSYDFYRDKDGNKVKRPPDPYSAVQARIYEKILSNASKKGELYYSQHGLDGTSGRPLVRPKFTCPSALGDVEIDITELMVKTGAVDLHETKWNNPDASLTSDISTITAARDKAKDLGLGIHSPSVQTKIMAFNETKSRFKTDAKDIRPLEVIMNRNIGQDKTFVDGPNSVKIGDVWLDIPPTHLQISQLRSSQNIPLLGFESKPISESVVNRTVIKINLIFSGLHQLNQKLGRILHQYKYCPINIMKSKDLFNKLKAGHKWLSDAYAGAGSSYDAGRFEKDLDYINTSECVIPITMDNYTIYTIEGHPNTIGCSLQFSLFDFGPYLGNDYKERMEYIRYKPELYDISNSGDNASLRKKIILTDKETVRFKSGKGLSDIDNNPTTDLEESIHPYNYIIEHELEENQYTFKDFEDRGPGENLRPELQHKNPSEINILKIASAMSEKEFELHWQSTKENIDFNDVLKHVVGSLKSEIAHSISISYNNNFGWQPISGKVDPIAQYIGPGDTQVSINIKTDKKDSVDYFTKTFYDHMGPGKWGNYEDRYFVESPLLNLAGANVLSMQHVATSSIEGKPGWTDLNVMFNKSSFETIVSEGSHPVDFDDYWGLQRILRLFKIPEVKSALEKMEKVQSTSSPIHRIKGSNGTDVSGLDPRFQADLNNTFEYIENTSVIGKAIFDRFSWRQAKMSEKDFTLDKKIIFQAFDLIKAKAGADESATDATILFKEITNLAKNQDERKTLIDVFFDGVELSETSVSESVFSGYNFKFLDFIKRGTNILSGNTGANSTYKKYLASYLGITASFDFTPGIEGNADFELIERIFTGTAQGTKLTKFKFVPVKNANGSFTITVLKEYKDLVTEPGARDFNSPAITDEILSEDDKKALQSKISTGMLLCKPFAAHRYFRRVDNFISYSNVFSKTMGYWFKSNRTREITNKTQKIYEQASASKDYFLDNASFKSVYGQETFKGLINTMDKNPNGFLNIPKSIVFPTTRKETGAYKADSKFGITKDNLLGPVRTVLNSKGDGQLDSDFPFNTFSDALLNENYFRGDPDVKTYMTTFLQNNINKSRELEMNMDGKLSEVYDQNNKLLGIVDKDNNLRPASETNLKVLYPHMADDIEININSKPEKFSSYLTNLQMSMMSSHSDPTSVLYTRYDEYNKESVVKVIPEQVAVKTKKVVMSAKGYTRTLEVPVKEESSLTSTVSKETVSELENAMYLSQQPTVGLENIYPTYKLYVIHDNSSDIKYKSLDDYWDFRLVQDLMVVRDKNNPAHILKCRIVIDPRYMTTSWHSNHVIGSPLNHDEAINRGNIEKLNTAENYAWSLGRSPIRSGMRICLKLGYHTDPRALDTVFIGTITNLSGSQGGGIYDIEAQGDGRELCVPCTMTNKALTGSTFSDLINNMLRSNPNIIHFGKMYGSHLEQLSRNHKAIFDFTLSNLSIGLIGGTAGLGVSALAMTAATPMVGLVTAGAMGLGTLGLMLGHDGTKTNNLIDTFSKNADEAKEKSLEAFDSTLGDIWAGTINGRIFNNKKAGTQLLRHFRETFKNNNNPVDDNIFAFDIWTHGGGSNVNLKANNQKTVWDVMQDIKRMYPGWALDVRPYGNRSTVFLGSTGFMYWRTDDPLLAMAPALTSMDQQHYTSTTPYNDKMKAELVNYGPVRDNQNNQLTYKDISGRSTGMAPLIPFMKSHTAMSGENIIHNGIKATPDRGWNSVVMSKGADGSQEPEEYVADADLHQSALRRKFISVDWTDNSRLAQQYAIGVLKEGVERLYGGILILKGNSKIEPYDKIYVCDNVNKMFGWVQVETVIHKYDSEMGFTTHIVPNMLCSINNSCYQTTSDIVKKTLVQQYMNKEFAMQLAELAYFGIGAMIGIGVWPLLLSALAYEATKAVVKGIVKNTEDKNILDNEMSFDLKSDGDKRTLSTDTIQAMQADNWLHRSIEFKYNSYANTFAILSGKALRTFSDYKANNWQLLKDQWISTKTQAKGKYSDVLKANTASKETIIAANNQAKNIKALQTALLIKNELVVIEEILESKGLSGLNTLQKDQLSKIIAESTEFKAAKIFTIEDLQKRKALGGEAWAGAKGAFKATTAGSLAKAGSLLKAIGGPLAKVGILLSLISPITLFESFAVKAITKGQIITIAPIFSKDALLMPGLDGYKNNDTFMHMKDLTINAKRAIGEAWDAAKYTDVVNMAGQFYMPAAGTVGSMVEAVSNNLHKVFFMSTNRIEEFYSTIKNTIQKKLNKPGIGDKLKGPGVVEAFIKAGKEYGIDPLFLVAMTLHESASGNSYSIKNRNNPAGLTGRKEGSQFNKDHKIIGIDQSKGNGNEGIVNYARYNSVEDAIMDMGFRINRWTTNPIGNNPKVIDIYTLNKTWATDNNWHISVGKIYSELQQGKV